MKRILAGLMCLFFVGCGLSKAELKAIQVNRVNTSYESLYSASIRALAEMGYLVNQSDKASGIISTEWEILDKDLNALFGTDMSRKITITVVKIDDGHAELKVDIRQKSKTTPVMVVQTKKTYDEVYAEIEKFLN